MPMRRENGGLVKPVTLPLSLLTRHRRGRDIGVMELGNIERQFVANPQDTSLIAPSGFGVAAASHFHREWGGPREIGFGSERHNFQHSDRLKRAGEFHQTRRSIAIHDVYLGLRLIRGS